MDSQLTKEERIEIRVSSKDKKMFKLAQKLSGDKTFSNFIVRIVKNHAEDIIAKNNKILISDRDRQLFFDSVFSDTKPNQNLINAAKRFKSKKT
ncbi:MAG: DUF1778 domain-containing protein [Flavobacteriaceae bacterium]|jgi:uncharacterized protein (DUF1778 family)|nr:DUF1778 domain-containing protein [Flavobacteriaceae bacterium]NVJ72273.1 DUF1778 domain-containing protein [Flavobacteriaceae bacterium]